MSFIHENWMLFLVLIVSGSMLIWPYVQRLTSPIKEIGTVNAVQLVNSRNAIFLDIREPNEFEGGSVPNAIHIPLGQLASRRQELAKLTSRPVIVYSARSGRTRAADSTLAQQGFKEIYHLNGGFAAWKSAGLPIAKGS